MEHTLEITSLAHGGDGVGRVEGQVCFVPLGLPGDTLRVKVRRQSKKALWAELVEVLEASPHRTTPVVPNHDRCGSAPWAHFAYPAQGEWKQRIVKEALERIAGVETDLEWAEDPELRLGYRTRAEFHGDGKLFGFFARGTHDIVDTEESPVCHRAMNRTLKQLRSLQLKGTVTVTVNPEGEDVLVWTKFTQRRLKHRFPLANTPDDDRRTQFDFDGVPIVNGAFSQSSLLLNRLLVHTAHGAIGKPVSLLDLYCGNGNLSIGLAGKTNVVGMDHTRPAVQAARRASGADYRSGGEDKMLKLIRKDEWDTILLDPPRAGAKVLMPALAPCHARAIVYVSCDPATLARDVKTLTEGGWKLTRTTVVDMFPYTPHIETVCRLER